MCKQYVVISRPINLQGPFTDMFYFVKNGVGSWCENEYTPISRDEASAVVDKLYENHLSSNRKLLVYPAELV